MRAHVLEGQVRAFEKCVGGRGNHHVIGAAEGHHAGRGVHGEPANVVADELHLAGMDADPDLEIQLPDRVADRAGALDGRSGAVERDEEAVAGRIDLATPVPPDVATDDAVVLTDD